MIFGVADCVVNKSASNTLHDLFIFDVSVVRHHTRAGVVIVHLAVYEVVTGCGDNNEASVVLNGAYLVAYDPV